MNQIILDKNYNLILKVGDFINDFKILAEIGKGSYGKVYLVVKDGLNYALKISPSNRKYYMSYINETNLLKILAPHNLHIINIIENFDYNFNSTKLCKVAVFELLGDNLYSYYKLNLSNLFYSQKIYKFVSHISMALIELKKYNIVHQDMKPENICLTLDGLNAKLIDFGLSKMLSTVKYYNGYTASRWYRPPESVFKQQITCSFDIWSFGCIIYELYTGRPLFNSSTPKNPDLKNPDMQVPLILL